VLEFFLNQNIELLNTNVAEDEEHLYDDSVTYKQGDKVIFNHKIFEWIDTNNGNELPTETSKRWANKGATNAYKMIDEFLNTQTKIEDELVFELDVSYVNVLGFFRCEAKRVKVEIIVDKRVVSVYERDLIKDSITNIYEYLGNDLEFVNDFVIRLGFQLYNAKAKITLTRQNNTVKLGRVTKGMIDYVGDTLWGVKNTFLDFSYIQRDENFGTVNMIRGNWAKRADVSVVVDTAKYDLVMSKINKILGKETIFIIVEKFEMLMIYGFLKEHETILKNPSKSYIDLTIEGMI